ncbi:MAG TPA: beta-N-acetylhexosaminidase [Kofleriaceae bacterium]|nr:beta-N-acetylhexosaminidase [Kofleriaceae bacterium]
MRDDVGQLLWIGFAGTRAAPALRARLDRGQAGATIVFKRNLEIAATEAGEACDLDALIALTAELHRAAPDGTPALIAVDQEGGSVQRVRAPATRWPAMAAHERLAPPDDEVVAEAVGRAIGDELRVLGFDIDFAPVLDVDTNPANPIIGDRAFSRDPEAVARRALAFARGLDAASVLACGKHFPGHGDTLTDSHLELPRIDHGWERLERVELLPFRRAAAAGLPMIMTAHVVFAVLDPGRPATLSEQVVTGVLRDRLGYRGVIVSDDLDMRAIAGHMGADVAAVAAVRAGCDVLLLCKDEDNQAAAEAALIREAERDVAFRDRIREAAHRVRALKQAHAAHRARHPAPPRAVIGSPAHRRLAERLAQS